MDNGKLLPNIFICKKLDVKIVTHADYNISVRKAGRGERERKRNGRNYIARCTLSC